MTNDLRELVRELSIPVGKVIYLAVPITGGPRLWRAARQHGVRNVASFASHYPDEFKSNVVTPNLKDAGRMASQAGKVFSRHFVVNPAQVNRRGWSQAQYRRVWKNFLSRFADGIVVAKGWSYSHGCVAEVQHGLAEGIPIFRPSGQKLSRLEVEAELESRRQEAKRYGLKVPFLFVGSVSGLRNLQASSLKRRMVA